MSEDGRYVAFATLFPLVPEDDNERIDVYVRDRLDGTTELMSRNDAGEPAARVGEQSYCDVGSRPEQYPKASMSADGR